MLLCSKKIVLILADVNACFLAYAGSFMLIKMADFGSIEDYSYALAFVFLPVCMVTGMIITKSYDIILRYATIMDLFKCILAVMIGSIAFVLGDVAIGFIGEAVFKFFCCMFAAAYIIGMRMVYFMLIRNKKDSISVVGKQPTLIVGAGMACKLIIEEMKGSAYNPLVIADDDRQKFMRDICNVKVRGRIEDIPRLCNEFNIEIIMFAIPSCQNERRAEILEICADTGCEVKILPFVRELVGRGNLLFQAKKVSLEDLLGRDPIVFEDNQSNNMIENKVVMVTGGGGSIGSEICRQVAGSHPKKLIILDIYENNAYDIQQELKREYGKNLLFEVEIASVREYAKLDLIFEKYRPDVVFHAAAHKHVPLMEHNPEEAVKNNILGTYNCAKLSERYKTGTFVLISTDKAVNPTNVMGATKRACEMVIQYMSQKSKNTRFCAVRFGNVLGSNGSVIPLFHKQIEAGGPITVTDPEIIRYFMTIPEAVALVLKAASMAENHEIFVLDMGKPVKIVSLAEKLIKLRGYVPYVNMKIEFTGLRPGEKLYEELLMQEEGLQKTGHNKIFIGKQLEVNTSLFYRQLNLLLEATRDNNTPEILFILGCMVPTYSPDKEIQKSIHEFSDMMKSQIIMDAMKMGQDMEKEEAGYDENKLALVQGSYY